MSANQETITVREVELVARVLLSELEREALAYRTLGWTLRRIAKEQGCSVSTAHSRVARSAARLSRAIGEAKVVA